MRLVVNDCWFTNWYSHADSNERPKQEADYTRLVGDKFNKQGNLFKRLFLATRQVDLYTLLPETCEII